MRRARILAVIACALASSCSSGDNASTAEPPGSTATAATLADIAAFLAGKGIACTRVEIENEGPTAAPVGAYNRAMCYRGTASPLELLLYRSADERTRLRPDMTALPCASDPTLRALDGQLLSLAAGANFDIRAAASDELTPTLLKDLNAVTQQVAVKTGLNVARVSFSCR